VIWAAPVLGDKPPPSSRSAAWRHVSADLEGVRDEAFADPRMVETYLARGLGAVAAGIHWTWHRFDPTGVSVVGLGPCARVTLQTWPERHRATLDVYAPDPDLDMVLQRLSGELLRA
jgi:S-adenosylmethionine/arginine decarboxylase-like enzyme